MDAMQTRRPRIGAAACLVFLSNHGDFIGGGEFSFVDLVEKLDSLYRTVAVTPSAGAVRNRLRESAVPTVVVSLPRIRPWNLHRIARAVLRLVRIGRRVRAGLLYANGPRSAFYAGIAGRLIQVPVVWHCRVAAKDPYLDPLLVRLSTLIVANSRATADRFRAGVRPKVRVVYNGIRLERFSSATDAPLSRIVRKKKILLMAARASRDKRHDIALSVFDALSKRFENLHLVCIGGRDPKDPDWWKGLMSRTRRCRFPEHIHWLGHLDNPAPWFVAATLLLHTADNEAFGRVLVEAMAAGTPVVASKSGGIPEIVRDGIDGILVHPGDTGEFCDAVVKLLEDERLYMKCAESAQGRALTFSLERHVTEMRLVLEQAAGEAV